MTVHRNLFGNIVSHAGSNAIGLVMQMGLLLVLSRFSDVATFSIYLSAVALIGVAEMASDFGTRVLAVRHFARQPAQPSFDGVFGSKLIYASATLLIVPFLPIPLLSHEQVVLCLLIAISQPSTDPLLWYLEGKNRFDLQALIFLVWRVCNVLLLGLAGILGADVTAILWLWLFSNLCRWITERRVPALKDLRLWPCKFYSQHLRSGAGLARAAFPIGIAFFLVSLFQRLGVFLLGNQSDPWQIALYGATFTIVASSGFVGTSITLASFPILSRAIDIEAWDEATQIVRRKLRLISLVFVPACAIGMLLAPIAVPLLLGSKYQGGSSVMILLLAGLYISTVNFALKYVLNALHKNWLDAASAMIGIVAYCLWLLWPTGIINAERAAIAWGVSETAAFFLKWGVLYADKRLASIRLPLVLLLSTSLASIAAFLIN